MSKKILVLGNSDISKGLFKGSKNHIVTFKGRPEYDFSSQGDCDKIVSESDHDVVILTYGLLKSKDVWQSLTTNVTSSIYLIQKFYEQMIQGQIIVVSSAAVNWVSYPGIPNDRLIYNHTKETVSKYCEHMNRKNADNEKNVSVQVYEPNSFKSKMNPTGKADISIVTGELEHLVDHPRISVLRGMNRNL